MHKLTFIAFLTTLVCATQVRAQFVSVGNPSCGSAAMKWAGSGSIGTRVDVKSGCGASGQTPYLLMGGAFLLPLLPPIGCMTGCTLELTPWASIQGVASASVSLQVPAQQSLIGAQIRFQGLCLNTNRGCVTTSTAVELTIN